LSLFPALALALNLIPLFLLTPKQQVADRYFILSGICSVVGMMRGVQIFEGNRKVGIIVLVASAVTLVFLIFSRFAYFCC
jgi:hypothetical protein